ncbi:MAG: prolipoprotein diacylglyceryl transferase [Rikenellaceae bacterium]|nr:prolipoprotein diacylglyceryl transferase [Rikenellaceae bacterium]MCL2692091.1 prolipoprotein diacylglyceryl transferase [Rikenellaceae bacterium]
MNIVLSVVWDVNPNLFSIGGFDVRWYGLSWALAFALGMVFFANFVKREGLPPKTLDSIIWYGALATIIGARLGHCLFYNPAYYLAHPLEILYIREGGLASHGAAVGLLVGLWLFSRRRKLPYVWSLDRIMVPVTVGGAMVRLGNLMNSEIYGRPTGRAWGFEFVRDNHWFVNSPQGFPVHPTQIYEAACYLLTFVVLIWLYYGRDEARRRPGVMFGVGLIGVFLTRFFIEFVKIPQVEFEEQMTLMMGQWLSIPFILLGVFMIVWAYRRRPEDSMKHKQVKKEEIVANIRSKNK